MSDPMQELLRAQERQEERMKSMDSKLDTCVTCLSGPPGEPHKGLVVRMDRVEEKERRRSKIVWLVIGSLFMLVVAGVATMLGW